MSPIRFEEFFPVKHRSKHFLWRVTDSSWIDSIRFLEPLIKNRNLIPERDCLKRKRRRLIFRCSKVGDWDSPDLLVKGFPLQRVIDRLRYRRYGIAEATNLKQAKGLGLPVPTAHAVGLHRNFREDFYAVIMDYLPYPSMQELFLSSLTQEAREDLLTRVTPLVKMLYLQGVNHIDFGPHAILSAKESSGVDFIIDWQYANFTKQKNPELLAALAGFFGWSLAISQDWFSVDAMTSWFLELLDQLKIKESPTLLSIFSENLARLPSIEDRLNRIEAR